MAGNLLQTKLYLPRLRPALIARPQLIERLSQGVHRKLTLVSAPAGFGKTTLISAWITNRERVAWLSLDEGDAEPLRFLTYFVGALRTLFPTIGEEIMTTLQSLQLPPIEATMSALLNEIAATAAEFILVLDDYHVIDSQPIDDSLIFLLEHQPPQMHLVITTREDPAFPLARWRARGQMTELRAADLRFSATEAGGFLNQVMGLNLSPAEINALENRTEGWIAGLQMAALSIQGRADTAAFIDAFTGSHRYVLDYLVEEVLQRQPERVRNFLLATSILQQLTGPLCDAITGQEDGAEMLESLERGNLFVVPLDDQRSWYRYHHLFAEVLGAHLFKERPDWVADLHQKASCWYEQNQQPAAAIRHALAAPDFECAANLIEMTYPAMASGFRPATWLGWVHALPDEIVRLRPVLNLGWAYGLLNRGEWTGVDHYLSRAEWSLDPATAADAVVVNEEAFRTLPFNLTNARAYLSLLREETAATIESAQRTIALAPPGEDYHRGLAHFFLGLAHWSDGDLEPACLALNDSIGAMHQARNRYYELFVTVVLGHVKTVQGNLHEAADNYEQAYQMSREPGRFSARQTFLTDLYVGLAELHRERNDLEAATHQLQKGQEELSGQAAFLGSRARWCMAMARVRLAQGDPGGALELLQEAEGVARRDAFPEWRTPAALKARIWLGQGRLADSLGWAQTQNLSPDDALSYRREFDHITLAKILVAQYRQEQHEAQLQPAHLFLERLQQAAEVGERRGSQIEILLQQSLLYEGQGDSERALTALEDALHLAEPENYSRLIIDEGQPILKLLKKLKVADARLQVYVHNLLLAFNQQPTDDQPAGSIVQPLIEPLSERELEVLQLVAEGLTNREIAQRLFLAVPTVKGHNRNIYSKLQAQRRTEAIARARDLGLLSD